jgi:hypothetical protein
VARGEKIRVSFDIPNWLISPFVFFVLLYRRARFGCAFRKIPLTKGKFAIVDPDDYEHLSKYRWSARKMCNVFYALRKTVSKDGRRTEILMHRCIIKPPPGMLVDHINHNGLDNRKANLRAVTYAQNTWNKRKLNPNCGSKYKGVSWYRRNKRWSAKIHVNGTSKFLGLFENELDAAKAYDKAARKFYGQFALLNFPDKKRRSICCMPKDRQ